jgi:hypothetical protein
MRPSIIDRAHQMRPPLDAHAATVDAPAAVQPDPDPASITIQRSLPCYILAGRARSSDEMDGLNRLRAA